MASSYSEAEQMEQAKNEKERQQSRFSLNGKTAVVTGGHRGIGAAISRGIANSGGNVIVFDRSGGKAVPSPIREHVEGLGGKYGSVQCDLSDSESIKAGCLQAKALAKSWSEEIKIIVNNAGVALLKTLEDMDEDETWNRTMKVNLTAPMLVSQALVSDDCVIVNLSSIAGEFSLNLHAAYCSSKAGLEMLTKCMTVEWSERGIRANAVAPAVVLTEMGKRIWVGTEEGRNMLKSIPMRRFVQPFEVADAVVFLASDASKMINGSVLSVDGGFKTM